MRTHAFLMGPALPATSSRALADPAPHAVTEWAAIVQQSIHNPSKAAVPALVQTERTYEKLNVLMREIGDARVLGGLHWRHSIQHGMQIGRKVAAHVTRHHFQPAE